MTLTFDPQNNNKVTFTPSGPKMSFLKSPPGLVSGSFPATIGGKAKTLTFKGVALQKQNRAVGLFRGGPRKSGQWLVCKMAVGARVKTQHKTTENENQTQAA